MVNNSIGNRVKYEFPLEKEHKSIVLRNECYQEEETNVCHKTALEKRTPNGANENVM